MKIKGVLAVALMVLVFGGCDKIPFLGGGDEESAATPAPVTPPPVAPPGAAAPPAAGPSAAAVPPPAAPPGVAAPTAPAPATTFVWTEAPAFNMIPAEPAAGMANGQPMPIEMVVIEPGSEQWRMVLGDTALEKPTDFTKGQYVSVNLPERPATGKSWLKPMEYGGGYFQIKNDPNDPEKTTSWNADNAWAIEFTKWDVAPYDESKGLFQEAGKASGRVAIAYKGNDMSFQNSWIAGTFEDATVRYMGKPKFSDEKKKTAKKSGGSGLSGLAKGASREEIEKRVAKEAEKHKDEIDAAKEAAQKRGIKIRPAPVILPGVLKKKTEQ